MNETEQSTLIRSKLSKAEYAEIRKEAIDRGLHVGEWVAQIIRVGRECIIDKEKEGVA